MKYLIVNADDFGFSPGVNGGILQAHLEGIVSSTTVMVNLPQGRSIVEAVAQCSGLGAGVHLNITYGKPVLSTNQVPSLVDDSSGNFIRPDLGVDIFRPGEVEAEWRAQLALFQSWGLRPTHLDSHHHVHTWPGLRELVAQIAREFALPVRFTDQPTRELLGSTKVPVTDFFIGDFYGAGATTGHLQAILQGLKPGVTELMCHPAIVDQPLTAKSSYTWPRSGELAALIAPEISNLLNSQGIKLINYADLVGI